jgi:hypothetical protein
MKLKHNKKFNPQIFENARVSLELQFPGIQKKAFYIAEAKETAALPAKMREQIDGAVGEIAGDSLRLRTYRLPREASTVRYKIDEIEDVNKILIDYTHHDEIENHYISQDIPDDMMDRNQMTLEYVSDDQGNLRPNVQSDGTIKTYINFPDPTAESIQSILAKKE